MSQETRKPIFIALFFVMIFVVVCTLSAASQNNKGVPAQIVVTVSHAPGGEGDPPLMPDDLAVTQNGRVLPIIQITPLRGPLEMFLLLDHCSNCEPGTKFDELRGFIGAQLASTQLASTKIGVAAIQDGKLQVLANPTSDRVRAEAALSSPEQSKIASPFPALGDLIRVWPQISARRVVVMISSGMDPQAEKNAFRDPAAEAALAAAQRAGVIVYAIYHPSSGYMSRDFSRIQAGQIQLAHVADETGGQAYFVGLEPLPSLTPFLDDIMEHLSNQFLVEVLASAKDGGSLQPVSVKDTCSGLELMAPYRLWIPERKP